MQALLSTTGTYKGNVICMTIIGRMITIIGRMNTVPYQDNTKFMGFPIL